jgi:tetratricopeptide (TPR) repeat protein
MFTDALALIQAQPDPRMVAYIERGLGGVLGLLGDHTAAVAHLEAGLHGFRQIGDVRGMGIALIQLATVHWERGALDAARAFGHEHLALARELGDQRSLIWSLYLLGQVAQTAGDLAQATTILEEALPVARELDYKAAQVDLLLVLGQVALDGGTLARAQARLAEGLALLGPQSAPWRLAGYLEGCAALSLARAAAVPAARLLGAADALRTARVVPLAPVVRPAYEGYLAAARAGLDSATFAAAWAAGAALPIAAALEEAGDVVRET